jgi:hypothetical protein
MLISGLPLGHGDTLAAVRESPTAAVHDQP